MVALIHRATALGKASEQFETVEFGVGGQLACRDLLVIVFNFCLWVRLTGEIGGLTAGPVSDGNAVFDHRPHGRANESRKQNDIMPVTVRRHSAPLTTLNIQRSRSGCVLFHAPDKTQTRWVSKSFVDLTTTIAAGAAGRRRRAERLRQVERDGCRALGARRIRKP